jgi:hypothetical protein
VTGKIKGVVDGAGNRVNGSITVSFDLTNRNARFSKDATAAFSAAGVTPGDGIAIDSVRVIDNTASRGSRRGRLTV